MPSVTYANMRTFGRLLMVDSNATAPGLSDANFLILTNDALFTFAAIADGDEILFASKSGSLTASNNTLALTNISPTPLTVEAVYLSGVKKLKKVPLHEILEFQAVHANDANSQPSHYAIEAGGSRTNWTVYFDTKSDATYTVVMWYRKEPTAYSADADLTPFGDGAAYTIARMAAAEGSRIIGRPGEFIDRLEARLPEQFRHAAIKAFRSGTHGGANRARPA